MHKRIAGAALALTLGLPIAAAMPAHAKGGGDATIARGSCSGATGWKIKAKADDGRLEVEAEIDSNRRGQTWRWTLRHNGRVAARGRSTTAGRSGSFEVERRVGNAPGADRLAFRAVNVRSGEVCVARVRH
jgi:uncharacterized protein (DUF2235 family)